MLRAVSDLLDRIRRELDERVVTLKPAAEEYARLLRAVDALDAVPRGADAAPPAARPAARAARPAARPKPASRRKATRSGAERAAPGATQLRVIEQLRIGPGSSSTAVAQALGISANAAAATISRLVKQGRVSRLDTGGYAAAEPAPAAPAAPAAPPPEPTDS